MNHKVAFFVTLLTLLAPALGGAVTLWAQAAICGATGLLFLFAPPKRSLGTLPNFAFAALMLLAVIAFLPAQSVSTPAWRSGLTSLGVHLPNTISAQPFMTLEATALLFLELVWAYYVLAIDWSSAARRQAWVIFAIGTTALAATLIVSSLTKVRIPFWSLAPEYGFFPNRNHTSNVLGLGGVLVYALAFRAFGDRKLLFVAWLGALSVIACALILNYSRGGIILLIGGALVWHLYWVFTAEERRHPLMASAMILLLLALLAWVGPATMARFSTKAGGLLSLSENVRLAIYRDAFALSLKSPLTGVALGNFSPVFTITSHEAIAPSVAGHPESDWLWVAVEMGWIAPVLIGTLFCWWLSRCLPLDPGTFRLLRFAAVVCVCGFTLHTFFDVPGHQIGALWPAIFFAGTAMRPQQRFRQTAVVPNLFRVFGAALIGLASLWFALIGNAVDFPSSLTVSRLERRIEVARDEGYDSQVINEASRLAAIAPLNWQAYQALAASELVVSTKSAAKRDFAVARHLLPDWPDLWLKQGVDWLMASEADDAFDTWSAMLRRFPADARELYGEIYLLIKGDAELLDRWRVLGRENKQCLLQFFRVAGPVEFRVELDRLLAVDPGLQAFDGEEKGLLFRAWYERGDKLELAQALRKHAGWERIGWRELARTYGDYGDYASACEIVHKYAALPAIPDVAQDAPLARLAMQARLHSTDASAAAYLCVALAKAGHTDAALARIQAIRGIPGSPAYLSRLEAQLWEDKGDWKKAWSALTSFANW